MSPALPDPGTDPGSAGGATRTSSDGPRRLAPGTLLAGRYRILELVGVGGMGVVYRALDEQLGVEVAVKTLRGELAPDEALLDRFRKELILARQVSHRNVVRIHDIGHDGPLHFLSMDFVPGRSLREVLEQEGPMPPERALAIGRQLAEALDTAHREGVVHRDLKPANVLIGDGDRAYVTDFGVARSLRSAGLTRPGSVIGTLDYLSPEQAKGEEVDGRSDLYALGLLLFEMLSGKLPFAGGTDTEVLAQRLAAQPRNLTELGVAAPRGLRAVIKRLLARDPADRYQTAGELLADLDRGITGLRPALRLPRRGRWAAAAALVLVALAAAGWLVWRRGGLGRADGAPAATAAAPAKPRHAVAVLPLADQTGRPDLAWAGPGLAEMLAAALAESPELRVVDSARVLSTLADLKLPAGPLPAAQLGQLADLLDADRLVTGSLRAVGGRVRVDLRLVAADLPNLPAEPLAAERGRAEEVLDLVAELGRALRARLTVEPVPEASEVASAVPAAAAAYAEGVGHLLRGEPLKAAPVLERATAADPAFAAAWVRLAHAQQALGHDDRALAAVRQALGRLQGSRSRLASEARALEARLAGDPERARRLQEELVARYPNDLEARVALAEARAEEGELAPAAAELKRVVALDPDHPRAWFLLGKYSIMTGQNRAAVDDHLVHAMVIQNRLGNEQGKAEVLNALGVAYGKLGDHEVALRHYQQAAELRKKIGDDRGYASTLRNLAAAHTVRGEGAKAEELLGEGLAILERIGDRAGVADLHNDFGVLAEERGDPQEALDHYRRALQERKALGERLGLAQSLNNVGFAYYLLGQYDNAMVYWRQALDLYRQAGDATGVVLATQSVGLLELAQGEWPRATRSFLSALEKSRELNMQDTTAASLGHLGRLAHRQGRFAAALANYREALAVCQALEDRRGLAEFTLAEAEVYLDLGAPGEAARRLDAAARWIDEGGNREHRAELLRLRGVRALAGGETAAARRDLAAAVEEARASHSVVGLLQARLSAARAAGTPGARELAAVKEEADLLGHAALRLAAAEALAESALAAGDAARAEGLARAALGIVGEGGYAGEHRLRLLLAQALAKQGRGAEAERERQLGRAEVERLRRELPAGQRASFERLAAVRALAGEGARRAA
ncbi:MAG TPA: tetratricopeptide repeat protein [Thermoanaerobaculia bacterium]|nr:tetratricopeptide repeat protein [Thermoanaerobaculia bacterium]